VTAIVDRSGADIATFRGSHRVRKRTLTGPDDEIERNARGGWAQARYQHRAEDSWSHNAAEVARQISASAAGVHAVQLVREHLPITVRNIHREVTTGLEHDTTGRVELTTSTLHQLIHEAAADTLSALRRGAVDHLLVTYRPSDARLARATPSPQEVVQVGDANDTTEPGQAPLLEVMGWP
jgi:hypothetical protein